MTAESSCNIRQAHKTNDQFVDQTLDFCDPMHGSGTRHYAKIIEDVVKSGNQEAFALAGSMSLDLAGRLETSSKDQAYFLDKAGSIWTDGLVQAPKVKPSPDTLTSRIGMACLPSFKSLILDDTLPGIDEQNEMFRSLSHVGYLAGDLHDYYDRRNDLMNMWDTIGIEAEVALLMLHQWYTRPRIPDSMLALPSYLSQDEGRKKPGQTKSDKWDVSVYEEFYPDMPRLVSKIQAKSKLCQEEDYEDDITVVDVSRDLGDPINTAGKILRPRDIIREVINEMADPELSEVLIERVDLLQDKLDETKVSA